MSEKRFEGIMDDENSYPKLLDNETKRFYYICDNFKNVEFLCEELNSLVEENQHLKKELKKTNVSVIEDDCYEL